MISRLWVLIAVPPKIQAFLDVTMRQIITIYLSQQHNTISHLIHYKHHHYKALQFYTTQIHSHRVYTRYCTLTQSCGIKPFTNVSNNRKYDCYVSFWYASQVSFLHLPDKHGKISHVKILDSHGGDYEECHFLGCVAL